MDLEQLPKKLNRTVFPAEIEALLVKERQARQDTNVPLSTQVIIQIVSIFKFLTPGQTRARHRTNSYDVRHPKITVHEKRPTR